MMLDKTTMAVGLEARVPLLDHRLVECAARIPGRIRMRDGRLKALLREALRGHLPDPILDRPKQGFGPPVQAWMRGPLGAAASRLLGAERTALRDVVDPRWIASVMRDDTALAGMRGWRLLVLDLWWRAFVEREDMGEAGVIELAEAVGTRWT
jgi:asparagine synthase (glutamine-hydrolysing)